MTAQPAASKTELIFPTEFMYRYAVEPGHIKKDEGVRLIEVPPGQTCFLCGRSDMTLGVKRKSAIKENFTDIGSCKGSGDHACHFCARTVTQAGRQMKRIFISPTEVRINKDLDIGKVIQNPPPTPFLIGIGDWQKHFIYKCKVTVSSALIYVYDTGNAKLIEINRAAALDLAAKVKTLAKALKTKPYGIAKGNFGDKKLSKLSEADRALYAHIKATYSFDSDTIWAALEVLRPEGK